MTRCCRRLLAVLPLLLSTAVWAQRPPAGDRPTRAPSLKLVPPRKLPAPAAAPAPGHDANVTRCELCHTTAGWTQARFAHERTGFPLEGAHATTRCADCHSDARFSTPLGQRCSGCHRDPHRGELGQRCEGCHDALSWRSRFGADAHRRTAFPLEGRHAMLPCAECHGESRELRLARPVKGCADCHLDDYQRTTGTALDHGALGFSTECAQCHQPSRFTPARFPDHDRCFPLGGDHARVACRSCHLTLPSPQSAGSCASGTATCTSCHEHSCARSDEEHQDVAGYQCVDRKCFECHRGGGT